MNGTASSTASIIPQSGASSSSGSVKCKQCSEVFISPAARRNHLSRVHQKQTTLQSGTDCITVLKKNERWPCPDCPKSYGNPGPLQTHFYAKHGANKNLYALLSKRNAQPQIVPAFNREDLKCHKCGFYLGTLFAKYAHDYISHGIFGLMVAPGSDIKNWGGEMDR